MGCYELEFQGWMWLWVRRSKDESLVSLRTSGGPGKEW